MVTRYYVRTVKEVLRPGTFLKIALFVVLQAGGQLLLALAFANLARQGVTFRSLDGALTVGFIAVVVRAVGMFGAASTQSLLAGQVGGRLRVEVLSAWLTTRAKRDDGRALRHPDQGVPTAVTHALLGEAIREVERGIVASLNGARAVLQILPVVIILLVLAPKETMCVGLVFGIFASGLSRVRRRIARSQREALERAGRLAQTTDDAIRHADVWRTYGAERGVIERVAASGESLTDQVSRTEALGAAMSGASEVLGACAVLAVAFAVRTGWLSDGTSAVAVVVAGLLSYRPLRDLGDARTGLVRAGAAYDLIKESCEMTKGDVLPLPRTDNLPLETLRFRSLELVHGSIGKLDATVQPGEIVALVGPTGVGKTTLLRTLLGLLPEREGEIVYGGRPLAAGAGDRPFAWVPQEAPMLGIPLLDNVAMGGDRERAREALEAVGAGALTEKDAAHLSGGERQWVSLARAIASGKPVLLLDEPTSGLDRIAQERVLAAIARLRGTKTVILVTHRPEPEAIADRVIHLGARASLVTAA